jgi:hypothetical protein
MRSVRAAVVAAAIALGFSASASAQPGVDPDAMIASMEAAQAQAQAGAVRPGDEALSCDQLQAEFTTVMNDPAIRQGAAELGQWAQAQQAQMNAARTRAMAQAGASMAIGLASSFIPGLGYAQQAMMAAQHRAMQAQAEGNMQEAARHMGAMQAMLPAAYRGQRLYELAQARECAFLQEAPVRE